MRDNRDTSGDKVLDKRRHKLLAIVKVSASQHIYKGFIGGRVCVRFRAVQKTSD